MRQGTRSTTFGRGLRPADCRRSRHRRHAGQTDGCTDGLKGGIGEVVIAPEPGRALSAELLAGEASRNQGVDEGAEPCVTY